jgi:hydroxymethylglutaryl-CoA synthase
MPFLFQTMGRGQEKETKVKGIVAYGAYVPFWFVGCDEITGFLGERSEKGKRAVASFDEDTTTMGVEAARSIPVSLQGVEHLFFATSLPAYADKTNAAAIHAALRLPRSGLAADFAGSVRGGVAAMLAAAAASGLAVLSDIRFGLPGSADERQGGDGGAAFLFGAGDEFIAELVAHASVTAEFLERWRLPGDIASRVWEERFGAELYQPLMQEAATEALRRAGLSKTDHLIVTTPHRRVAKSFAASLPWRADVPNFDGEVGYAGAADAGLLLADVLDRSEPGQTILLVAGSDGADAIVFRTTPGIAGRRARRSIRSQIATRHQIPYGRYLTWRGLLRREPPRRPDPTPPASPPSARGCDWKFALLATRCDVCATVHAPPLRVCRNCRAVDRMQPYPLSERQATVAACTVDRLAYSPSPPMVVAVIDFDGGGRLECEVADVDPQTLRAGSRVEMTFRKLFTANGIHNYFWKAQPIRGQAYGE